jgi:hypothetical protein
LSAGVALTAAGIGTVRLERGLWWRVYSKANAAHGFNPSSVGNARFSPLLDASGHTVPTLYLAQTPAAALMETVLHDCPAPSSGYILTLPPATDELRRMACLAVLEPLVLADFSAIGLRRLGLTKAQVVGSDKSGYPQSRELAQQVYALRPDIQGIQWNARQDDRASAIVLFEPRTKPSSLAIWHQNQPINDGMALDELIELLDQLDAGLVFG